MKENIGHSGAWGIAAIMVVIVAWVLYRYLAPRSWREWASAGLVQAFLIALYAEMYGFPLTIYLLARFFGLDRSNLNANLWSTLLGVGETGMLIAMLLGYALLFVGLGLFVQGGVSSSARTSKAGSQVGDYTSWCGIRSRPGSSSPFSAKASCIGRRCSL